MTDDAWRLDELQTNNEAIVTVTETYTEQTPITVFHGEDGHIDTFQAEAGDRIYIVAGSGTELEAVTHDLHEDEAEVL